MAEDISSGTASRRWRDDKVTAGVALVLFAVLSLYQVWDLRAALTDFDGWWGYFEPVYPGDDFVKATLDAEQVSNWHVYYRSLTVVWATRRQVGGRPDAIYAPERLWLTWGTNWDDPTDYEHPGLRDVSLEGFSSRAIEWVDYDPALPDEVIERWREDGRLTEMEWNVVAVEGDEEDREFVIHADWDRDTVYVVPLSLSPLEVE